MRRMIPALLLALCLPAMAEAKVESLEGASLGQHWFGPNWSLEDLRGRVVMVELWGFN